MKISLKYAIALTAALGLIPVVLDTTIVSVALVPMVKALKADINSVQWVITAYFLANAAAVAPAGYLGNRFGRKRLFMLGIAVFTASSFLCGIVASQELLIVCRVLQGLGGGLLIPLGQAIGFEPFAPEERAKAGALVAIPILLAPVFGPIVGGLLVDHLGWESIFFVNVPIGILAVLLAWRVLPADAPMAAAERGRSFDYVGLALSTLGVLGVIYGFKLVTQTNPATQTALNPQGDLYGWSYTPVWVLLGGGLLLLLACAIYEIRVSRDPVLELRLFRRYDFSTANLVNWFASVVSFGLLLLLPVFLQQVRLPHLSAVDTGLALLPTGLATLVGTILAARLYEQVGPRILVLAGAVLMGISAWQLGGLTPTTTSSDLAPWLALIGMGLTLTGVPVQTLALRTLSGPLLAKGSSLAMSTRFVFASVGSAVLTSVFVQQTTVHANALKAQVLGALPSAALLNPNSPAVQAARAQLAAQAGTAGINDVFTYLVVGIAVMMLLALALPGAPARQPAGASAESTQVSEAPSI